MSRSLLFSLVLCVLFLTQCKFEKSDKSNNSNNSLSPTEGGDFDSRVSNKTFEVLWQKAVFHSGECISVQIQVKDEAGELSTVSIPTRLVGQMDEKAKVYSDAACTSELEFIDLEAGASSKTVYYRTEGLGPLRVQFMSGGQMQESSIDVLASRLSVSLPSNVVAGEKTALEIKTVDESGAPVPASASTSIQLAGATFFATENATSTIESITLSAGQSGKPAVFVYHEKAETLSIEAQAEGLHTGSLDAPVAAGSVSKLNLMGKASISAVGCEAYHVGATDAFGNVAPIVSPIEVSLGADARFYSDSNCQNLKADPKVMLTAANPDTVIYLIKGKAEDFMLVADDAPTSGLSKAELAVQVQAGVATQIIVDSKRQIRELTCNAIRVFAADKEGNPAGVPTNKNFKVEFKAPVNETAESVQARFTVATDCSGTQGVALNGTFTAVPGQTNEVSFGMIATEGDVVMSVSDVAAVFPAVDTPITVSSSCGPASTISFAEWGVSYSNGKLTIQGGNQAGFIRVGYTNNGNVYVMNQKPADDPNFNSAVIVFCVNEVEVNTGTAPKEVDMYLGYINGVATAGRLDGKVKVNLEGQGGMTIFGSEFNDVINGTPGNDVIIARGGNDVINGNGGSDLIYAGSGNDIVNVGSVGAPVPAVGDLIVYGGSGGDTININAVEVSGNILINGDGPNQP